MNKVEEDNHVTTNTAAATISAIIQNQTTSTEGGLTDLTAMLVSLGLIGNRTIPMKWSPNEHRSKNSCACCSKAIKGKWWVEVIDGGLKVADPDWHTEKDDQGRPLTHDPDYKGYYPICYSCAKNHFKGFAVHENEMSRNAYFPAHLRPAWAKAASASASG